MVKRAHSKILQFLIIFSLHSPAGIPSIPHRRVKGISSVTYSFIFGFSNFLILIFLENTQFIQFVKWVSIKLIIKEQQYIQNIKISRIGNIFIYPYNLPPSIRRIHCVSLRMKRWTKIEFLVWDFLGRFKSYPGRKQWEETLFWGTLLILDWCFWELGAVFPPTIPFYPKVNLKSVGARYGFKLFQNMPVIFSVLNDPDLRGRISHHRGSVGFACAGDLEGLNARRQF